MRPVFDQRVGYVAATYKSTAGEISSSWQFDKDGCVNWTVDLAPGISADVSLGKDWTSNGKSAFGIPPGEHSFKIKPSGMAMQ